MMGRRFKYRERMMIENSMIWGTYGMILTQNTRMGSYILYIIWIYV